MAQQDWSQYRVPEQRDWSQYRVETQPKFTAQSPVQLPTLGIKKPGQIPPTPFVPVPTFDPLRRTVGKSAGNLIAGALSGPLASEEVWQDPYGKAGVVLGSALDIGAAGLGIKALGKKLFKKAPVSKAIVPEVLPPEIIPGKRRLTGLEEPKGLLPPATNPEIIPKVESDPRFVSGQRGIADTTKDYRAFLPDVPQFGKARATDIVDEPIPGKVSSEVAASYGVESAGSPSSLSSKRKKVYDTVYQNLIHRGANQIDANHFAEEAARLKYPDPKTKLEGYTLPVIDPPTYSGAGRKSEFELLPPVSGEKVSKSLPKVEAPFTSSYPKTGPVKTSVSKQGTKTIQKEIKADEAVMKERAKASGEIEEVVKKDPAIANVTKYPAVIEEASKRLADRGKFKTFATNLTTSIEREFEKVGDAGRKINFLIANVSHTARSRASIWDEPLKAIEKFSPEKMKALRLHVEGKAVSADPEIISAAKVLEDIDVSRTQQIQSTKLINPDTGAPLQPRKGFWPRQYSEEFKNDPKQVFAALKGKFPGLSDDVLSEITLGKTNPEIIDRIMHSAGVDRETAEIILNIGRESAEKKISAQFSRKLDLPGFREDVNVWKEHNWDIARKTSEQDILGRLNLADPESEISKLLDQTPNPQYYRELVELQLGRAPVSRWEQNMSAVNKVAAQASSAMYLSMFPVSNTAGLGSIAVIAGPKNFSKALTQVIATNRGETRAFATEAGAKYNITKGILEAISHSKYNPIVKGITASENFNRTVAATAGKLAAKDLHETLLLGKLKPGNIKFLEDLTLTDATTLLSQKALTEKQITTAGGRMPELTQGIGEARKVPYYWNNPYFQIPLLFKKYAFQQTKAWKDAIKRNPARSIPLLIGTTQVFGELVGDVKTTVGGSIASAIEGEDRITPALKERGAWVGRTFPSLEDNKLTQRLIDNAVQGWMLGLVADAFFISIGEPRSIVYDLSGPTIQTGADFWGATTTAMGGDFKPLGRETLRRVPYTQGSLQKALLPTEYQKNQEKNRNLPSVPRPDVPRPRP